MMVLFLTAPTTPQVINFWETQLLNFNSISDSFFFFNNLLNTHCESTAVLRLTQVSKTHSMAYRNSKTTRFILLTVS